MAPAQSPDLEPVVDPVESFELLEPAAEVADPTVAAATEPAASARPEAKSETSEADRLSADEASVDAFELAARLFSFTGETPVQRASVDHDADVDEDPADPASVRRAARSERLRRGTRQLATMSFSVGVIGIVGTLTVGMTTPADALAVASDDDVPPAVHASGANVASDVYEEHSEDIQAYVTPATIENVAIDRDENYTSVSMGEIASQEGITNYSNFFVNDPNAAIQWPFAVGVPITYGFGARWGRTHEGADFVPGEGAAIQAVADGTVRIATNDGGAYGVTVVIDHIIDGQLTSSRYAHMLYGTLQVSEGQQVTVGTVLGNTGNTGRSYGAHTHFEILPGGATAADPIAWLREYAGRDSLG